ncbi:MAG: CpsD/CapB family tyrosine-protein kinase, partial [Planctomycetes bacterium]|nr:CpsD/CapB family tyrosine-protein kinase [Planctomycetota bacterium]
AWHDRLSPITEQFRALRAAVVALGRPRRLLVTSALPGEGKSVTALNLAVAFAEEGDKEVLVVDADLRKPSLHRLAGVEPRGGLSDVLNGTGRLGDFVTATGIRHLTLLPAGRPLSAGGHGPGDRGLGELLLACAERYDLVILDGPPVLVAAEAAVLASIAEGTLFVVRLGMSPRALVRNAVAILSRARARVLGAVVVGGDALPRAYQRYVET